MRGVEERFTFQLTHHGDVKRDALFFVREVPMNIDEQVELLMQGTEYGDEELKKAMEEGTARAAG